jgi:mannosyl-oligosaccharide glucosidase
MTSSMMGGIGYFYGQSLVDANFSYDWDAEDAGPEQKKERQPQLTPERALLTATPSRSFFPRGFYWDEGFHLLLIGLIDPQMRSLPLLFCDAAHVCYSLQILQSWVSLIDQDGWVGREQILGDEARSKVRLPLI